VYTVVAVTVEQHQVGIAVVVPVAVLVMNYLRKLIRAPNIWVERIWRDSPAKGGFRRLEGSPAPEGDRIPPPNYSPRALGR